MRRFAIIALLGLPLAAQAQNVTQSTVIDTVPHTVVVDSSDVNLPSSCQFRGPISRNSTTLGRS